MARQGGPGRELEQPRRGRGGAVTGAPLRVAALDRRVVLGELLGMGRLRLLTQRGRVDFGEGRQPGRGARARTEARIRRVRLQTDAVHRPLLRIQQPLRVRHLDGLPHRLRQEGAVLAPERAQGGLLDGVAPGEPPEGVVGRQGAYHLRGVVQADQAGVDPHREEIAGVDAVTTQGGIARLQSAGIQRRHPRLDWSRQVALGHRLLRTAAQRVQLMRRVLAEARRVPVAAEASLRCSTAGAKATTGPPEPPPAGSRAACRRRGPGKTQGRFACCLLPLSDINIRNSMIYFR
jgi:hypothetical protein